VSFFSCGLLLEMVKDYYKFQFLELHKIGHVLCMPTCTSKAALGGLKIPHSVATTALVLR